MASDVAAELAGLAELHLSGAISDDEFAAAKRHVLEDRSTPGVYAQGQVPPGSTPVPSATSTSVDASARMAGVGALIAALGLAGTLLFDTYREEAGGLIHVSSFWWGRSEVLAYLAIAVLIASGLALLQRPTVAPAALVVGPAAMLGVVMGASAGSYSELGIPNLAIGYWAALVGAAASILAAVGAATYLLRTVRTQPLRLEPVRMLAAAAATALAIAACLTSRYAGGLYGGRPIFSHVRGGWYWIFVIGVFGLTACLPAAALLVGRDRALSLVAIGAGLAIVLWDDSGLSAAALRFGGVHPRIGFWLLLGAATALVGLAALLRQATGTVTLGMDTAAQSARIGT